MKLDAKLTTYIQNAIKTCQLMKLDDLVIEKGVTRSMNVQKTVLIIDHNGPELPFTGLGINGVPKLVARMGLISDFTVNAELMNDFVFNLELKADGVTTKYRCGNVAGIKTVRQYHGTTGWTLELSPATVAQLTKAVGVMGAEHIHVVSTDGNCVINLISADRDTYEQAVTGHVEVENDDIESKSFNFRWDAPALLTALKHADKVTGLKGPEGSVKVAIGREGTLSVVINTITVLFPTIRIL